MGWRSHGSVALLGVAVLALAACGSTSREGGVGDTLSDGKLRVALLAVDEPAPPRGRDVSGLATPAPGTRFFGAEVRACNGDGGPAIGAYSFKLELSGGGEARLRFPQRVLPDDFESVRAGCGTGWILFEVPDGDSAEALKFRYDDTASAAPSDRREKHARFRWDVTDQPAAGGVCRHGCPLS